MLAFVGLLALTSKPVADLPFTLVDNHVYLAGSLNGRPVGAILDTGCQRSLADDALGASLGGKHETTIGKKMWAVTGLSFMLRGTKFLHSIDMTMPLAFTDEAASRPVRVVLGTEFFRRFRVEIDYAASRVRLYDTRSVPVPHGAAVLPLRFVEEYPYAKGEVEAVAGIRRPVTMLLDTGDAESLTVTSRGVRRLGLAKRFASVPVQSGGLTLGGRPQVKEVRLGAVRLGTFRLARPVADLQIEDGNDTYDVTVGYKALRRFTVTLDYANHRILLRPNAAFHDRLGEE